MQHDTIAVQEAQTVIWHAESYVIYPILTEDERFYNDWNVF